jgi:hypothetical protein
LLGRGGHLPVEYALILSNIAGKTYMTMNRIGDCGGCRPPVRCSYWKLLCIILY